MNFLNRGACVDFCPLTVIEANINRTQPSLYITFTDKKSNFFFYRFAFIVDTVNTILSICGLLFNGGALAAFIKNGNNFRFPIK